MNDHIVDVNKKVWTTQVHALRHGKFTFVAQTADGFRVEFKPFATRSEAASKGKELLTKVEEGLKPFSWTTSQDMCRV